jgi:hypothetical protein
MLAADVLVIIFITRSVTDITTVAHLCATFLAFTFFGLRFEFSTLTTLAVGHKVFDCQQTSHK